MGRVLSLAFGALLFAPSVYAQSETATVTTPRFSEDGGPTTNADWALGFHGYARMPLRMSGLSQPRPPYLVDDHYFLSGFSYLRIAETEYVELFLSFERDRTRFVVGLVASQFSDWSETTLQGQQGVALAFIEHTWEIDPDFDLGVRAGMFWDRYGYTPYYDTYVLGRMHVAGARVSARAFDLFYARLGFGAHADLINANQGFTPVGWANVGVDLGFLDAGLFYGGSYTKDSEREFSIVEEGSLRVIGAEARADVPYVGTLWGALAHLKATSSLFLAAGYEVLHSTGGRGLTQHFLGPDSDNGTGEILVFGFAVGWQPKRAALSLFGPDGAEALEGLEINIFGLLANVASNQASDNPLENFHERIWFKWGIEPVYRPPFDWLSWLFVSLRYDRVILDKSHESLSFRATTIKLGVTPIRDLKLDLFFAYTGYSYGENIQLRPNQIPGDLSVTVPDDDVLKLQAQIVW